MRIGLLERHRDTIKPDIDRARWWCSLIDVDHWNAQRAEMTERVEVAWHQPKVHFGQVLHDGTPAVAVIWFDQVSDAMFHAEPTSFEGKPSAWYPIILRRGVNVTLTDLHWPI
jgi:hypothetical protein